MVALIYLSHINILLNNAQIYRNFSLITDHLIHAQMRNTKKTLIDDIYIVIWRIFIVIMKIFHHDCKLKSYLISIFRNFLLVDCTIFFFSFTDLFCFDMIVNSLQNVEKYHFSWNPLTYWGDNCLEKKNLLKCWVFENCFDFAVHNDYSKKKRRKIVLPDKSFNLRATFSFFIEQFSPSSNILIFTLDSEIDATNFMLSAKSCHQP